MWRDQTKHIKYNAERRADRIAKGLCRDCTEPVATKKDGTPARLCQGCLDDDSARLRKIRDPQQQLVGAT